MVLKAGVRLNGIRPELVLALMIADRLWPSPLVVTAVCDSTHHPSSKHYVGFAADLRTNDLALDAAGKESLRVKLAAALGPDFDVILENAGLSTEHCHIEFDPKTPINL